MSDNIPTLAIIGRPNVGKSTLFNKLCKKKKAIVAKVPGVTRDFQIEKVYWQDKEFNLIDTSGFEIKKNDTLQKNIDQQFYKALNQSDAFLFICDGQSALTQLDDELFRIVRQKDKPVVPIVNKIDTAYFKQHEAEFYELLGNSFTKLCAEKGLGLSRLLKHIEQKIALAEKTLTVKPYQTKVIIMGRPNVGKSTLMNQLLSEERMVVSPLPGTTRDSIDAEIVFENQQYLFIDTAGLRKKRKISDKVEILSTQSAIQSLERAEILLLVIDATEGPTEQDIKMAGLAWDRGVGIILLINKWDLLPQEKRSNTYWQNILWNKFRHFDRIPFLFISATEKRNIIKIFQAVLESKTFYGRVIGAEELKEIFLSWTSKHPHPRISINQRMIKVIFYHCKQIKNAPPVFEVKTNFPDKIKSSYTRFLINNLRQSYGFWGIPIKINYHC